MIGAAGAPASVQASGLKARRAVAVTAAGAALILIAFVFDAAPLFVPGVALTAIGATAPAWVWIAAHGARARRMLGAERVIEDEPLEAIIQVRRGLLGRAGWDRIEVIDPLTCSRLALTGPLSPIQGGREASVRVVARFPRRGPQRLAPPSLVVSDPLELARVHTRGAQGHQRLLVLPRTEPVRWLTADRGRRSHQPEGDAASEAMAATDVDGLRPYRPGTPASRIHWPALARGAGLIERRLQADGDRRPLVVLDSRERGPGADRDPERLDAAVRATASLVLELARRGGCGLLLPGEQRATAIDSELTSWPAAYARLALVGSGGALTRAPALAGSVGRTGPLIYVAAAPADRLTAVLATVARGSTVLVVPDPELVDGRPRGARGRMQATLSVSGCRGFALGLQRERHRPRARSEVA